MAISPASSSTRGDVASSRHVDPRAPEIPRYDVQIPLNPMSSRILADKESCASTRQAGEVDFNCARTAADFPIRRHFWPRAFYSFALWHIGLNLQNPVWPGRLALAHCTGAELIGTAKDGLLSCNCLTNLQQRRDQKSGICCLDQTEQAYPGQSLAIKRPTRARSRPDDDSIVACQASASTQPSSHGSSGEKFGELRRQFLHISRSLVPGTRLSATATYLRLFCPHLSLRWLRLPAKTTIGSATHWRQPPRSWEVTYSPYLPA